MIKAKIIFKIKSDNVLNGKKRVKKLKEPTKLPKIIFLIVVFLFRVTLTVINKRKSKKKFKKKTRSKYIVILSPVLMYHIKKEDFVELKSSSIFF